MGILNWIFNHKNNNFNSAPTNKSEITVEKALAFSKEYKKLNQFFTFLKNYVQVIINSEPEIEKYVNQLISRTKQNLKKELLIKELWILRYVALYVWFFDLKTSKDQNDVKENIALINRAIQDTLKNNGKTDYLSWLTKGFVEYVGIEKLDYNNLEKFKSNFTKKIAEKIPLIAFECTDGRLAGELHDSVIEFIMMTIQKDKKTFELRSDISLTEEEGRNIEKIIDNIKPNKKT